MYPGPQIGAPQPHQPGDDLQHNRGAILLGLGDVDSALEDFDKALSINPKNWQALFSRTIILSRRDEHRKAWEDANRAIEVRPGDSRAYVNRAFVYRRTRQKDAALRDLDYALTLNSRDVLGLRMRALVLADMDQPDRALVDIKGSIAAGIDSYIRQGQVNGTIYFFRAKILYRRNEAKAAMADLDRLIALNPTHSGAYNFRAWIMATHPDPAYRNGKQAVLSAPARRWR